MNIVYGLVSSDSGTISIDGRPLPLKGPRSARRAGIGMVHQHFMLVPAFTIAENLMLGDEPTRHGLLDLAAARRQVEELSAGLGFELDPDAVVADLPVAALLQDPLLLTRFRRTTMMLGAADCRGNVTPTAEFNAWADAHAARIVLSVPGTKTLVGWDVSRRFAVFTKDDDAALRAAGPVGAFAVDINADVRKWGVEVTGIGGYDLPDPAALAVALEPGLVTASETRHVDVSLDPQTRGQLIIDRRARSGPPNAEIVTAIDRDRFVGMLLAAVSDSERVGA